MPASSQRRKAPPEAPTGVIYARYSSHAQRDCSIEQQIDARCLYSEEDYDDTAADLRLRLR